MKDKAEQLKFTIRCQGYGRLHVIKTKPNGYMVAQDHENPKDKQKLQEMATLYALSGKDWSEFPVPTCIGITTEWNRLCTKSLLSIAESKLGDDLYFYVYNIAARINHSAAYVEEQIKTAAYRDGLMLARKICRVVHRPSVCAAPLKSNNFDEFAFRMMSAINVHRGKAGLELICLDRLTET